MISDFTLTHVIGVATVAIGLASTLPSCDATTIEYEFISQLAVVETHIVPSTASGTLLIDSADPSVAAAGSTLRLTAHRNRSTSPVKLFPTYHRWVLEPSRFRFSFSSPQLSLMS